MNRLIVFLAVMFGAVLLTSCGTTAAQSKADASERMALVKDALADRNFKIDVDFMYPMKGQSRSLTPDYSIEVRNDSLISHLPYVGEARNIPYGGGNGLIFEERINSYNQQQKKADEVVIEIGVKNSEDTYLYTISVFDNGKSSIGVRCRERTPISYSGELDLTSHSK